MKMLFINYNIEVAARLTEGVKYYHVDMTKSKLALGVLFKASSASTERLFSDMRR